MVKAMVLMMENHRMKKNKKRWSVVDTVIILLILVSVAGLVYRVVYAARKDADADPTMYRVSHAEDEARATATGVMICANATLSSGGGLQVGDSGRYLTPGSVLEVRTDRALLTIRVTSVREHS